MSDEDRQEMREAVEEIDKRHLKAIILCTSIQPGERDVLAGTLLWIEIVSELEERVAALQAELAQLVGRGRG